MPWAVAAAGVAAGGAIYASNKASNAQTDAANQANGTLSAQSAQARQDNLPYMQRGNAAGNALNYRLGLNTSPTGGTSGGLTSSDLVDTSQGDWKPNAALYANSPEYKTAWDQFYAQHQQKYGVAPNLARGSGLPTSIGNFDLDAYNKAHQPAIDAAAQADPNYGSLLRNFSQSDLDSDVVYKSGLQFGLDEGVKGITRQAAANGGVDSGAVLKALTRFGNDYGSTKAGDAFNRFNTNKSNTFNMLSGVAGTGQVANSQVNSAGQNMANQIGQNQIGVGNARGASAIATGNALSGAATGAYNAYQQNRLASNPYGYTTPNYNDPGANYNGWTSQG